jgi:hypothetical protein
MSTIFHADSRVHMKLSVTDTGPSLVAQKFFSCSWRASPSASPIRSHLVVTVTTFIIALLLHSSWNILSFVQNAVRVRA